MSTRPDSERERQTRTIRPPRVPEVSAVAALDHCWSVLTSAVGLPFRAALRKWSSTRLKAFAVPVFITKCGRDLNSGWHLLSEALVMVESYTPLWTQRMPRLF